ncbi:MAG: hypothetical protein ACRCWG_10865 [Sarcina sp.]
MKKTLIKIVIVLGVCGALVGGYYYEAQAMESNTPSVSSKVEQNSPSQNAQESNNQQNNINQNVHGNNNQQNNINQNSNKNSVSNNVNSNNDSGPNSNISANRSNTKASQGNSNSANMIQGESSIDTGNNQSSNKNNEINNTSSQNNTNKGTIEVIPPKLNPKVDPKMYGNVEFPMSTIIVKNTSGQKISDSMLYGVIKNWIFKWQYGREGFCVATGENWDSQWFDAVPHSEVINAFIQANGEAALSQNISANEINKGAMLFTQQANSRPIPFTTKEATVYIQNMLNGDSKAYGKNDIAKVILHTYKNYPAGLYYVYTKQMLAKGYKQPFWYVYTNTGQATGV